MNELLITSKRQQKQVINSQGRTNGTDLFSNSNEIEFQLKKKNKTPILSHFVISIFSLNLCFTDFDYVPTLVLDLRRKTRAAL